VATFQPVDGDSYAVDLLPGLVLGGFGHGVVYTSMFIMGTHDVASAPRARRERC
jgi:hypothetical protein